MAVYYVVRGAKMKCIKGSNERKINLPVSHGSYANDKPILNKKDNTEQNISYFGVCEEKGCFVEKTEITVIDSKGNIKTGIKCVPQIVHDWIKTKGDTIVEGEPALTTDSVIYCCRGGNITFVTSGQDD
ncbi:DUF4280 domain-containing protein [Clostridium botulinum]|nr:DUF4280 domain-containing protein [Clostridium botulinum]